MLGIVIGLGAALLSLMPYASLLEEKIGLGLLFTLRGERQPPTEVVIVGIDRESANLLAVSAPAEQWPRRLHAELIRRLHEAGAELVGFNVFFSGSQPEDDAELAAAMRESGAVVLADYLRLKPLQGGVYVESLEEPAAALAQAALATAPFLLAQGEEADKFLIRYGESGDHPTLPLALFRLFAGKRLGGELQDLARAGGIALPADRPAASLAGLAPLFAELEDLFGRQPESRALLLRQAGERPLPPGQQAWLRALLMATAKENTRYFDHYGAAGAIPRIAYHRLLRPPKDGTGPDLRGKIVLVGFDEDFQADKSADLYFSPFSAVSSLELAATAVANLLEGDGLQPLFGRWSQFAWLLGWGYALGLLSSLALRPGVLGITLLAATYLLAAQWLFGAYHLWMPLILPMLWLFPLGTVGCLLNNYLTRSRENQQIHSVISRFIPEEAAKQMEKGKDGGHWESKLSFGVCLATDAGQYTSLAEKMKPMELGELMNEYYTSLFPAVRCNGGWVSDVTGDAMMAVWSVPAEHNDIRVGALRAALDIRQAVETFQDSRQVLLPVRMGLHCGEMRVGFVGGKEHGAYRAVGDTVNTAARLEGLNKLLGTRILVSEPLIRGLAGFVTRPMGSFMLAGKSRPVAVHELIAPLGEAAPECLAMIARFSEALALFQAAQWQAAATAFEALAQQYPDDGPTRFYSKTARANAADPQATPELAAIAVSKPTPGTLAGL